ncbi:hypothetical protein VPHD479_0380 [Vibrio phage D479]
MNMIEGSELVTRKLRITDEQLAKAVYSGSVSTDTLLRKLKTNFKHSIKLPDSAYLHNWDWVHDVEHYTSHSWESTEILRPATKLEINKYNALNDLVTLLNTEEPKGEQF